MATQTYVFYTEQSIVVKTCACESKVSEKKVMLKNQVAPVGNPATTTQASLHLIGFLYKSAHTTLHVIRVKAA